MQIQWTVMENEGQVVSAQKNKTCVRRKKDGERLNTRGKVMVGQVKPRPQ